MRLYFAAEREYALKKIVSAIAHYIKTTDILLLGLCLATSGIGLLTLYGIYKAEITYVDARMLKVQLGAVLLGLMGAVILSKFDMDMLTRLWRIHAPACYLLVLSTAFLGEDRGGNRAWIPIPGFGTIQPTEFLKISFIITFALHLSKVKDEINSPVNTLLLCLHGALPVVLIHFAPRDDGSGLVFVFIFCMMMFVAGISPKYIGAAGIAAAVFLPIAWIRDIFTPSQKQRILTMFTHTVDPLGVDMQQLGSELSIGSGQLWGIGLFSDQHRYVIEMHNDFIFAFIAESFGFIGSVGILALLSAICLKVLSVYRRAEDDVGRFVCVGVFSMLAFQMIINIGVCIGVLPVIGLTLPLLSQGGSSVLAVYLAIGLVLNVYMHGKRETIFS